MQRVLNFLLTKVSSAEEKDDIATLQARRAPSDSCHLVLTAPCMQDGVRLLMTQLMALPAHKRSIADLRAAGEYVDLADLWLQIDTYLDGLDCSVHTEENARRVHDALMLLLCFREHPVTRPTCMRLLLVPGVVEACSLCTAVGCLGNSWSGATAVIRHYKTAGTYGDHTITVKPGSRTEDMLQQYTTWARQLLVTDQGVTALFLTHYGRAFTTDGTFNMYLPRLLFRISGAKLSWTKVRAACAAGHACCSRPASLHSCATSPPTGSCLWPRLTSWRGWRPACRLGVHGHGGRWCMPCAC